MIPFSFEIFPNGNASRAPRANASLPFIAALPRFAGSLYFPIDFGIEIHKLDYTFGFIIGTTMEFRMKNHMPKPLVFFLAMTFLLLACRLPGMLPLTPQPDMETSADRVIEVLNGQDWVLLQSLAPEQYTEEDFAKPGTLTFTAVVTNEKPVYFNYGWCATDEATLQQNVEHIVVSLFLNGGELGGNVVHNLSFQSSNELVCADFGVLLSNWEPGEYELKAVAAFDEKINDGLDDYNAGDYIFIYNVTVEE